MNHMTERWHWFAGSLLFALSLVAVPQVGYAQQATPVPITCATVAATSTAASSHHGMSGHSSASPMAGMSATVAFDQLYIEMMIPHHASVIALAQVALPTLTDPRLQAIAQAIIDTQTAEVAELTAFRSALFGSTDIMPMDDHQMSLMMTAMPGMGSLDAMAMQMDPVAQVTAFCAAENPDLAFIDLTIPHHEMAVIASQTALTAATHPEIRDFAQKVIDAQMREITELTAIRHDLTDAATPTSAG